MEDYTSTKGVSSFRIPSGSHDNHTSANLKVACVQTVDLLAPSSAQNFRAQKTVKQKQKLTFVISY